MPCQLALRSILQQLGLRFTKSSFTGDSKDIENGTWMLKKNHHYKYHCARDCETFDNELLFVESAGTTNNNAFSYYKIYYKVCYKEMK